MRTIIAAAVLVAAAAGGCSSSGGNEDTGAAAGPPATTVAATRPATTAKPKPPSTTVSERLAHWEDVVKTMRCAELADLEQKRLAIQFNDQAESLVAIHDRQAKLHC